MRITLTQTLILSGVLVLLSVTSALAWTGPTQTAPNGNVSAPINVGTTDQVKNSALGINGLAVFGNSLLQASSYLNWGATAGTSGYGIRDNAGILEFKNSGGTWASIQSIVTTLCGGVCGGADNLGNHTATTYLQMGAQWINFNGGGLYSTGFGNYFWPSSASYWTMRSDRGMQMQNIAGSTVGYFYHDGSSNIGILSSDGSWRVRATSGSVELYGVTYATDMRSSVFYDRDNTGYYVDPNNTSRTNYTIADRIDSQIFYDANNAGYYVDANSTSRMNYTIFDNAYSYGWMQANVYYDANNSGYYLDPQYNSNLNVIYGSQFLYSSDKRLKSNIHSLKGALSKILRLDGVSFEWLQGERAGEKDIGVIAQEVEKVLPEAVQTDAEGYKAVDYPRLVPLLINAIKEQQGEIDSLTKRIEALERAH